MQTKVMKRERLSIDVSPLERKKIKIHAAIKGKTIKDFLLDIVREWMRAEEEKRTLHLFTTTVNPTLEEVWDNDEDSVYDDL